AGTGRTAPRRRAGEGGGGRAAADGEEAGRPLPDSRGSGSGSGPLQSSKEGSGSCWFTWSRKSRDSRTGAENGPGSGDQSPCGTEARGGEGTSAGQKHHRKCVPIEGDGGSDGGRSGCNPQHGRMGNKKCVRPWQSS